MSDNLLPGDFEECYRETTSSGKALTSKPPNGARSNDQLESIVDAIREAAGCQSRSVESIGDHVLVRAGTFENLTNSAAPRSGGLVDTELEILRVLADHPEGLAKTALSRKLGYNDPPGQFSNWLKNLKSRGLIESGPRGRGSHGYQITNSGRDMLASLKNGAE